MDDTTTEMLSRYLDGDLDAAREQGIVERLQTDAVLRSELEGLKKLRAALSTLAEKEKVPAELDALIEPLRRGRPEAVAARPWARWLATAAVAVVGVTVIVEVNLRSSRQPAETAPRSQQGPPAKPTERFSLAPLPTSAVAPEDQLLGVSERLLARPIPEMEFDENPALQVFGPLEAAPNNEAGARRKMEEKDAPAANGGVPGDISDTTPLSRTRKESGDHEASFSDTAPAESRAVAAGPEKRAIRNAPRPRRDGGVPIGQAQLFIFIDGKTSWRNFEPRSRCDTGRYSIRIRVGGGVVREVWAIGGAASDPPPQNLCAGELARGLEVVDVADGEYAAEIVVEPRGTRAE